jgi:hypothetical protein
MEVLNAATIGTTSYGWAPATATATSMIPPPALPCAVHPGYLTKKYGRQAVFNLPAYGGANCAVRRTVLQQMDGRHENSVTQD